MHLPVGILAFGDKGVERPGRRPHDIAARLIIFGISDGDERAVDERAEQPLHHIVGSVVVLAGKVLFEDVRHDVVKPRDHLVFRERIGEFGVEAGKSGENLLAEHVPYLELLRMVGDDRAAVHLAARAHHREHAADGHDLAGRLFEADKVLLPRLFAAVDGNGHRLRVVADGAAADGEDEICLRLAGAPHAFVQLFDGRVGHDARVFKDVFAAFFENGADFIVDAVLFDRAAAVDEQHVFAVFGQLLFQPRKGVFAEIDLCGVAVGEIA